MRPPPISYHWQYSENTCKLRPPPPPRKKQEKKNNHCNTLEIKVTIADTALN